MAERRIFLVRHGETEWSKSGQHTGRTNIALTANGERQAKSLGKLLAGKKFALILASPMGRAQATARLAGINEFEVTEDLHEWNYGIYEGLTTKSVREKQPDWTIWETPIPQGEAVEEVGVRCRRLIERFEKVNGNVACFAHGHILRILGACWMGLPPIHGRNLGLHTATLSILGYERETRVIEVWNQSPSAGSSSEP
jgi:probable phosphoglycerate mutase